MRVCGIELKGNEAIICMMELSNGLYSLIETRATKLSIKEATDSEQLKKFQFDFAKLMQDYKIDHVVIKERLTKGKFAGGAVGFKLEAAIQLIADLPTSLLGGSKIKEIIKQSQLDIDYRDMDLKQFQEAAFMTALAYLEKNS
jgi:hypothetical protein